MATKESFPKEPLSVIENSFKMVVYILTWQGRHGDHEGGFPRARLTPWSPGVLTSVISPNVGNSTA